MRNYSNRIMNRIKQTLGLSVAEISDPHPIAARFRQFQDILALNNRILQEMADMNRILGGDYVFDQHDVHSTSGKIADDVEKLVFALDRLAPGKYQLLHSALIRIRTEIEQELSGRRTRVSTRFVMDYGRVSRENMDDVGAKNANLAEVGAKLGLRIPNGFALTASAYHAFMVTNGLEAIIARCLADVDEGKRTRSEVSAFIGQKISAGLFPAKLTRDLNEAVARIVSDRNRKLVLRSSAWHEDRRHSFAGQYATVLNLPPGHAPGAYREVLASLYSETALTYRREQGYTEQEMAMPVACQEMIDAKVSGVLYTRDPAAPDEEILLIQATWGLGAPLVAGETTADRFTVRRSTPREVSRIKIVRKEIALRPAAEGGTRSVPVSPERQTTACLSTGQILAIAEAGIRIEEHFRHPQDIEFSIDPEGNLTILQTRPLVLRPGNPVTAKDLAGLLRDKPVLLAGQGDIAQRGIASGPVRKIHGDEAFEEIPAGAVVVASTASPRLAALLGRAAALLTDVGVVTGHLATVAREMRVPAILNCGDVTQRLADGQIVTVDAEDNVVYDGSVRELRNYGLTKDPIEETYEFRLLGRVLKKIEPLNLLDPARAGFQPEACQTLHDITRFVHEKAVEELIEGNVDRSASTGPSRRLAWKIPLDITIIDIGDGLRSGTGRQVEPRDILSSPMRAMLQGLAAPRAWNNEPLSVDFRGFMSSLTRTLSPELAQPKSLGRNLAVLSPKYVNLSLRLGYHFTMIDAYVSERVDDNYIYFRFFGGVTESRRRSRRARFVGAALARHDFRVEVRGDLVIARLKRNPREDLLFRLYVLGILIGFTRQLDVRMLDDDTSQFIDEFNTIVEESHGYENEYFDFG